MEGETTVDQRQRVEGQDFKDLLLGAGQKAGSCVILLSQKKGNFLCLRKYSHYVSLLFGAGSLYKNLL